MRAHDTYSLTGTSTNNGVLRNRISLLQLRLQPTIQLIACQNTHASAVQFRLYYSVQTVIQEFKRKVLPP
jgi:hypothetical protein